MKIYSNQDATTSAILSITKDSAISITLNGKEISATPYINDVGMWDLMNIESCEYAGLSSRSLQQLKTRLLLANMDGKIGNISVSNPEIVLDERKLSECERCGL